MTLYLPNILDGSPERSYIELAVICGIIIGVFILVIFMKEDLKRT